MHGSGRGQARRARASRGRVLAVAIAAIGAVLVVGIYAIVAITHGASVSATPRASVSATPRASVSATPRASVSAPPGNRSSTAPLAGGSYAGSLVLNDTGADLASWQSPSTCTQKNYTADGAVTTDSAGDILLTTTGSENSCVALASPAAYSSVVIEAEIDLPALPGRSDTVANWDSFWLTDAATWPDDGELDAVETWDNGVNAVSWHSGSGTSRASYNVSTDTETLPAEGANLTPGWHTVDVVYAKGFFAVYYDGSLYTSFTSSNVTGDPLTIYFTTDVYPHANADSTPASFKMRYLRIWSYK